MDKEKDLGYEGAPQKEEYSAENASTSRARNRTVMLTPEMTSQVRSRFQQESDAGAPPAPTRPAPSYDNGRSNAGFESPSSGGGFYSPSNSSRHQPEPAQAPVHPAPVPQRHNSNEGITWIKESPVVGFLVSYDTNPNGSVFELRTGRLIVTNLPSVSDNTLVLNDESVSSMHAIIRVAASGEIQGLDQLSEFGTKIKRFGAEEEESLSGEKAAVDHGDVLSFGKRSFHVCIVPRGNQE